MSSLPPEPAESAREPTAPAEPAREQLSQPHPPVPPVPGLEPPPAEPQWGGTARGALPDGIPPPPGGDGPTGSPPRGGEPSWSAWQGLLGLFAWVVGTFVVGSIVVVAAAAIGLTTVGAGKLPPGILIAATVAADIVFLAVPLAFAAITARPRAWHFGLRRTRLWPTLGWAVVALFAWFVFSLIYQAVIDPPGQQSTAEDLGVNRSTTLLVSGGFVVIVLAPIVEEFFFRGFIYRTLRNTLVGATTVRVGIVLAAVLDGLLFGLVHTTNTPIAILPVLAVLGMAFCLVYERTGSLFAVIALHATVNTLGYLGVADNSAPVALGFGGAMILACIVIPRFLHRGPGPAEAAAPV